MRARRLAQLAWWLLQGIPLRRPPDFVVGSPEDPYLRRWYLVPRNPALNVYLHRFMRDDDDRALHDHPWWSVSLSLQGSYFEQTIKAGGVVERVQRSAGDVVLRSAKLAHRIELPLLPLPCYTLFVTGPRVRRWGFHCPSGWRDWEDFVAVFPGGNGVGRGCA